MACRSSSAPGGIEPHRLLERGARFHQFVENARRGEEPAKGSSVFAPMAMAPRVQRGVHFLLDFPDRSVGKLAQQEHRPCQRAGGGFLTRGDEGQDIVANERVVEKLARLRIARGEQKAQQIARVAGVAGRDRPLAGSLMMSRMASLKKRSSRDTSGLPKRGNQSAGQMTSKGCNCPTASK